MNYKKEVLKRGLLGSLSALFLSYTVLVIASLGHETISLNVDELILQYAVYGISGFYLSAVSIIFNIEEWSLLKQFITHVICTLPFLPVAYFVGFMPQHLLGQLAFLAIYLSCYIASFLVYMMHLRKQTAAINSKL